mgnify:CR=1 FL=1
MSIREKILHGLIISMCFSVVAWLIVNNLIITIPFWKYFIIELFLVGMMKLFKFTIQKLNLN